MFSGKIILKKVAAVLVLLSFMMSFFQVTVSFAEEMTGNLALGKTVIASSNIGNGSWDTVF